MNFDMVENVNFKVEPTKKGCTKVQVGPMTLIIFAKAMYAQAYQLNNENDISNTFEGTETDPR